MRRILLSLAALLLATLPALATNTIITSQISNAPGRKDTQSYTGGDNFTSDRVLAGPGWNSSTQKFTAGSAVYLWIDTTFGAHSSGTGDTPFATCTTPGTTTATDGAVTWKCLTKIDYNTISAWNWDDAPWATSTTYYAETYVVATVSPNPPGIYTTANNSTFTSGSPSCTSASSGSFNPASDGTCTWSLVMYIGGANYSSQVSYIPKQQWFGGWGPVGGYFPTVEYEDYYVANVWYGGVSRQEYVDGANGETDPIALTTHVSTDANGGEEHPLCKTNGQDWRLGNGGIHCAGTLTQWPTAALGLYDST